MTTPEQIIAKIEEIEKKAQERTYYISTDALMALLELKQILIAHLNLPTADPPEGSPGQEDMKGS